MVKLLSHKLDDLKLVFPKLIKQTKKLGVVVHVFSPIAEDAETGLFLGPKS